MMNETTPRIRALAFTILAIRPAWPLKLIESSLAKSTKPFDVLADDAIDAARNPSLRSPAVLTSHRRPDRPLGDGSQPPPITRCETCGRVTDLEHSCRPAKPDWWPKAQAVTAQYSAAIRAARTVGDHQTANQLAQRQRDELRAVMA